ncbi:MAG: AsmA family protein [Rhodospirillales bacterium]|nr:AsmA family protein [Rhodospirillales bacterium]
MRRADLDIDRLNRRKHLPPETAAAGEKKAETPRDFSALKGLNASGVVKIGQLQVSNVKAANVRLEIKAADGKLDVAPHSASLYNGSLTGALSVNANNNRVALQQNLANVSINPLMKDALDKDVLEGRGNVALDVASGGTTVAAMKRPQRHCERESEGRRHQGHQPGEDLSRVEGVVLRPQGCRSGSEAGREDGFLRTDRFLSHRRRRGAQRRPPREVASSSAWAARATSISAKTAWIILPRPAWWRNTRGQGGAGNSITSGPHRAGAGKRPFDKSPTTSSSAAWWRKPPRPRSRRR